MVKFLLPAILALLIGISIMMLAIYIFKRTSKNMQAAVDGLMIDSIPITDPNLQKVGANFINFTDGLRFKLFKMGGGLYSMVLLFDLDFLPQVLAELKKQEQILMDPSFSFFEAIVSYFDQTTGPDLDPPGEGIPDVAVKQISKETNKFFGLDPKNIKNNVINQTKIDRWYRVLDLLKLHFSYTDQVKINYENRDFELQIPLQLIKINTDNTVLQFDPNNVPGLNHYFKQSINLNINNSQLQIYPTFNSSYNFIIPL